MTAMDPSILRNDKPLPTRQAPTIRIGLTLGSASLQAWEYRALEQIRNSHWLEIVFFSRLSAAEESRDSESKVGFLTRWYLSNDRSRSHPKPDALELKNVLSLVKDLPEKSVSSAGNLHQDLPAVDVIVHLGSETFPEQLSSLTRFGVWYYPGQNRGWQHGYAETLARREVVATEVCAFLPSGQTVSLTLSYSSASDLSPARVRNPSLWKASALMVRSLHRLATSESREDFMRSFTGQRPEPATSSNGSAQILKHVGSMVAGKLPKRLFIDQWHLLYRLDPSSPPNLSLEDFSPMIPPKDRFWADPFVISRDGKYYIFIEESLMKPRKKGFISVIVMDEKGNYEPPVKILEQPYHLSYPFLFERSGELFMIPESAQNSSIDIYRCEDFPFRWKYLRTILNGTQAVDTTLVAHDDRWWMLTNMVTTPGASLWDELFVFWTNDPIDGVWEPHPLNPVISDARRSRPAGACFMANGKLYRPSQDCGKRYGYALNVNEILRLDTRGYEERISSRVEPPPGSSLKSVHTLNHAGSLTVMDGILRRSKFN